MRCRLWSALRSPGADAPLRLQPGELTLHLVELLIGAILEIDQLVARRIDAADQLVELEVERAGIAARIRPEVRAIVAWARASGVEVIVASASPRTPVLEGVVHLDIGPESVFALTTKAVDGVVQPELTGVFVYADGKATAVSQGRPGAAVLGAFGDSAYDGALLRLSAVPVAIGPGPGLLRAAASVPGLIELSTG